MLTLITFLLCCVHGIVVASSVEWHCSTLIEFKGGEVCTDPTVQAYDWAQNCPKHCNYCKKHQCRPSKDISMLRECKGGNKNLFPDYEIRLGYGYDKKSLEGCRTIADSLAGATAFKFNHGRCRVFNGVVQLVRMPPQRVCYVLGDPTKKTTKRTTYINGPVNTNSCPSGTSVITDEAGCVAAASWLGRPFDKVVSWAEKPTGCVCREIINTCSLNQHVSGRNHLQFNPVCTKPRGGSNTCSCTYGTPATGAACTSNGAHKCSSCSSSSYYKNSGNVCVACNNMAGYASVVDNSCTQCTGPWENSCTAASCKPGYHTYTQYSGCTAYGGSCVNGGLISQADRTQNNHCGSCDGEFYLSSKTCYPCNNMNSLASVLDGSCRHCTSSQSSTCTDADCSPGYHTYVPGGQCTACFDFSTEDSLKDGTTSSCTACTGSGQKQCTTNSATCALPYRTYNPATGTCSAIISNVCKEWNGCPLDLPHRKASSTSLSTICVGGMGTIRKGCDFGKLAGLFGYQPCTFPCPTVCKLPNGCPFDKPYRLPSSTFCIDTSHSSQWVMCDTNAMGNSLLGPPCNFACPEKTAYVNMGSSEFENCKTVEHPTFADLSCPPEVTQWDPQPETLNHVHTFSVSHVNHKRTEIRVCRTDHEPDSGWLLNLQLRCDTGSYGGDCTNGALKAFSDREMENHCGSCNHGFYLDSDNNVCIDVDGCTLDGKGGCNGDLNADCSLGEDVNSRTCTCHDQYTGTSSTLADDATFGGCTADCQVIWGAWSTCTKTCGGGTKNRIGYASGPAECGSLQHTETIQCVVRQCKRKSCEGLCETDDSGDTTCYCDSSCADNGDCCSDHFQVCAIGI